MSESTGRWAWVEVDTTALKHNVAHLRDLVSPSEVWAVVKADGYGHGAVQVAQRVVRLGEPPPRRLKVGMVVGPRARDDFEHFFL